MLACVSPAGVAIEETLNTLKYANRAQSIKKVVKKNIEEPSLHINEYKSIISKLKQEIKMLRL
jgi:hypothetical protein